MIVPSSSRIDDGMLLFLVLMLLSDLMPVQTFLRLSLLVEKYFFVEISFAHFCELQFDYGVIYIHSSLT